MAALAALYTLLTGISAQAPLSSAPLPDRIAQTSQSKQAPTAAPEVPPITEEELRQQLLGKTFYLRGDWLDDNLHFDEDGKLDGTSPHASFTLSLVEITRVHLAKHRLELEGDRYGLHFLGALASEDQSAAFDKVRLTSKKKPLRISVERVRVDKPKKPKSARKKKQPLAAPGAPSVPPLNAPAPGLSDQVHSSESTHSVADANRALRSALDRIFSSGMDARMVESLPQPWHLYYKAVNAHTDYQPSDPSVLRQSQVDRKAKLLTAVDPASNDYAQKNGVAGVAMYHVVVGPDGKAAQIAVGRPIGFGLDENAVAAIRKATFQPAMKDGKPVPVLLNLIVEFRIYSKRTAVAAGTAPPPAQPAPPELPGPYSANRPKGP
ncbi:MAG: energy transducer TonB [Acidobacteriota bacterium]